MTAKQNEDGTETLLHDGKETVFHVPHLTIEDAVGVLQGTGDPSGYMFIDWENRGIEFTPAIVEEVMGERDFHKEVRRVISAELGEPTPESIIVLMRVRSPIDDSKNWLLAVRSPSKETIYLTRER